MDSETDDRDPETPSVGTAQDLEEALKWLEELTARQGKPADLPNPVPAASLDSPFHGLIDNDEGDLPDWLREAPGTPNIEGKGEGEMESRLDWLAKMAQRESIEELPTLEWRRLSEPVQASILPAHRESLVEPPSTEEVKDLETGAEIQESIDEAPPLVEPEPVESLPVMESPVVEEPDIASDEVGFDELSGAEVVAGEALIEFAVPKTEPPPVEEIFEPFEIEPDEELPPIDDLDAAMAWIEELAASQDAPIEDVPSVADRALASKLMIEAGLIPDVSPLDELGSDSDLMEGRTPTHPFIEEEDFADTVILVETMAADQGMAVEMPESEASVAEELLIVDETTFEDTIPLPQEVATNVPGEITPLDASVEALSFDEAMALLDEMAVEQISEPQTAEAAVLVNEMSDDLPADIIVTKEAASLDAESIDVAPLPAEEAPSVDAPIVAAAAIHAITAYEDSHEKEPVLMETEQDAVPAAQMAEEAPSVDAPIVAAAAVYAITADEDSHEKEPAFMEVEQDAVSAAEMAEEAPSVDAPIVAAAAIHAITTDEDSHEKEPAFMETEQDAVPAAETADEPVADEASEYTNGRVPDSLEAALLALDALALPTGKTLDDIDVSLRTARIAPPRDLPAALAWLEAALAPEPVTQSPVRELDEEDLIAQMPEDPDEVLAWLERMADQEATSDASAPSAAVPTPEETSPVIASLDAPTDAPLVEELAEADLLNMPEDPDEAMAWLEGLARGGEPAITQDTEQFVPSEEAVTAEFAADDTPSTSLPEETVIKPRRKKPAKKEKALVTEESEPPSIAVPAKDEPGAAWVDLLKPLD